MCAQHGRHLYGESPEWGLASAYHAKSMGVRREAESEGSWRQKHGSRYTNPI
ncbi:hypothetical protein ACFPYJ_22040 [Paenibacillus solisilvae]|uniref:Uncharacterized protein n=1 Tax=Paenibacillus solisilvae TaxID=2486751 RepID=A0ABW0W0T6_9BACL